METVASSAEGLLATAGGVALALAAFAVLLPLIVFVHEYGHFKVARLCAIRIDAFSIGFGPAMARWRDEKGTVWKISAIPLGGYVKFFGDANAASAGQTKAVAGGTAPAEAEPASHGATQFGSERDRLEAVLSEEEKRVCFHFKPVWQRMAVVAAGPLANFLLAIVIFAFIFGIYGRPYIEPVIGEVTENSAAAEAGFRPGDEVLSIDGRAVQTFTQMSNRVRLASDTPLVFTVERDGEVIDLTATPRRTEITDGLGNEVRAGQLGVRPAGRIDRRRYSPLGALGEGVVEVGRVLDTTVTYLTRIVTGREDPRQLGGPIKIAQFAGQAASSGFTSPAELTLGQRIATSAVSFFQVAALISVSIGFLNLLPVPVLDGGHLVFYGYEAVAGRPLPERVQGAGFTIGLAMVGTLMAFVVVNDVISLF